MVKSILAVRNDRFGEFLLNIPAIHALKETYPVALLTLAVKSDVAELAKMIEFVDKVVVWEDALKKEIRREKFDLSVIFNPTKETHWAAFRSGIPVRVGYSRKWGFLLTHKLKDTKYLGTRHEVDSNLELVNLIGAKTSDKTIALSKLPSQSMVEYAGAIAIHPFTSDKVKVWPMERFIELAERIARDVKIRVLLVGKVADGMYTGYRGKEDKNIIDLINKTSLVELAQVLRQCKLLITCDSGPMHLSAAVGRPVVALFRNDLPGKTAKRWGPWGEGHTVIEKARLEDISVDEVLKAVRGKI